MKTVSLQERYTLKAGDQSCFKDKICYSSPIDDSRLSVIGRVQILAIPSWVACDVKGRSPQPYRDTAQPPTGSAPSPRQEAAPQLRHSLPPDGSGEMLSNDVAGGVSCSLMSVPAPGSAGREWASAAQPNRSLCSPAAGRLLPPTLCPAPVHRGGEKEAPPTPSLPQIYRGNLPSFLRPWQRDSRPWPPLTPPVTSPRRRLGTAQVSRGCAGRTRTSPAGGRRWGRGGGARSFVGDSPAAHDSCAAPQC